MALLKDYVDLVLKDCRDDLANPTYTKQAGLLLMTVISANVRAYVLYHSSFIDIVRQNLRQPKSPSHTHDLLLLLNSLLTARMDLFKDRSRGHPEDEGSWRTEPRTHLDTLFHDIYLPLWTGKTDESASEQKSSLKQATQGLALLISQKRLQSDGTPVLLCSQAVCSEVCLLFAPTITKGLALSPNDNRTDDTALEDEAVLALRTIVMHYTEGYAEIVDRAKAEIQQRNWTKPSDYSLSALKTLLSRLAFIGCSDIPSSIRTEGSRETQYSPLQHFIKLTASLLEILPLSPHTASSEAGTTAESPSANGHVIASLHASILWFRDACETKYGQQSTAPPGSSSQSWTDEYGQLPDDWLSQLQRGDGTPQAALPSVEEDNPAVYQQFLRLSLFIVRTLYRSASSGPRTWWDERAIIQLSQMAALVVRNLDEIVQVSCNLAHEAFNFFNSSDGASEPQSPSGLFANLLTLGILQGLRPGALSHLVCSHVESPP